MRTRNKKEKREERMVNNGHVTVSAHSEPGFKGILTIGLCSSPAVKRKRICNLST